MFVNFILKPLWIRRRQFWHRFFFVAVLFLSVSHIGFEASAAKAPYGSLARVFRPFGNAGGDIALPAPIILPPPPPVPVQAGAAAPPATTAVSVMVKDHASGVIVYNKNAYATRPLASITKLMSALVFLDYHPDWTATSTVPTDAVEDTHMYAGDTYTVGDIWHTALVGSSNKAVLTLVDAMGLPRSAFTQQMNQKARELGMADTVFVEPTGLDEGNISTASDIAILLREALSRPAIHEAVLTHEYNIYSVERSKKHHLWNTDWLLLGWVPHTFHVLGGKTGYTPAAGYNVAIQVEDDADHVLDLVVLGAESNEARFTEARDVAQWVFDNFAWSSES